MVETEMWALSSVLHLLPAFTYLVRALMKCLFPVRIWRCLIVFMCFATHRQKTQSHKAVLLPGLVLPGVLSPALQGLVWPL